MKKEYYEIDLECLNCGTLFNGDDPGYYIRTRVCEKIQIPKGTLINQVECPICGCRSLVKYYNGV